VTRENSVLEVDNLPVAKGHVVLPKSVTASRIEENLKTIKLDTLDVEALDKIHKKKGLTRFVYPAFGVSDCSHQIMQHQTDRSVGQPRIPRQAITSYAKPVVWAHSVCFFAWRMRCAVEIQIGSASLISRFSPSPP
jgi:hypothetical protein